MILKRLIALANDLDEANFTKIANEIDGLIKTSQIKVNENDLIPAVQFYNDTTLSELKPEDLQLESVKTMPPEEFLPGMDTSDKGWLKEHPEQDWPKLLTEKYGRNFTHIVNMYLAGHMNPAIQINETFADGMARAIFYNAIGEDMPVANFLPAS